jgi:uncharacterized protein YlaI
MTEKTNAEEEIAIAETEAKKEPPKETTLILYFCKECKEVVEGKSSSAKKKYTFKCPTCKEVCAYGSETGIISHFKIKESSNNFAKIQEIKEKRAQKKTQK